VAFLYALGHPTPYKYDDCLTKQRKIPADMITSGDLPLSKWRVPPGPYGKGYPRGNKTASSRPSCRRATPQTAIRPFGGGPPAGHIRVGLGGAG
jgi:hypothetical protein